MSADHHPAFEAASTTVIVTNTAVVVWSLLDHRHEQQLEHLETVCLAFFALELAVRMRMHGWSFVRRPWCIADTVIIGLSLVPMLGAGVAVLRVGRLARLVHLARHVSGLRVLRLMRRPA